MKARFALALASLLAAPLFAAPGTLTVDVDKPGVKMSPSLYGIFFEEINNAGDGGLYAEMLRNRNFEEAGQTPPFWSMVLGHNARGSIELRPNEGRGEFNKSHLRIKHAGGSNGVVGVANDGYWGISVEQGKAYRLTLRARSTNVTKLTAAIQNRAGVVHATVDLDPTWTDPDGFQQWEVELKSMQTDPAARLVLSIDQPGHVDIDYVSLMPKERFKSSGLRIDLAEKLVELKPAFVRFPGGCWVEGDTMATAYRWKRTIGPLWERWTQPNLWGYQSPNGLGYHEYLQLCEDLGASAMFVANVGMSHKEVVPMDQMGPWVQDALDAIEYAVGDESTTWGKKRIEAGHPKPFDLKYLQIGNENGGKEYNERYALFYDAIKAKYPQIKTIACHWQGNTPSNRPVEILDEHYYQSPQWFFARQNQYDSYDRSKYKVYVGEYAVTKGSGAGNLISALGEAAFMIGMERNSDVIEMASYAPLFTHVDGKRWNPDLINFDSTRSYGTPSYHVQTMFATNKGDVVLPVKLERPEPATVERDTKGSGAAGLGTWSTQAEFKDFEVLSSDGKSLLKADLSKTTDWKFNEAGKWSAADGVLSQTGTATDSTATIGDATWADYSVRVKARKLGGAEGFLMSARHQDEQNYIWFNVGGWGNTGTGIERNRDGDKEEISPRANFKVENGRWYDLRLDVKGTDITAYIDGKVVAEAKDVVKPSIMFSAGATRDTKSGDVILKIVNGTGEPQALDVKLNGISTLKGKPTAMTMQGRPRDENTLDAPSHVAPLKAEVKADAPSFTHEFPAHSVTVIRVPAE